MIEMICKLNIYNTKLGRHGIFYYQIDERTNRGVKAKDFSPNKKKRQWTNTTHISITAGQYAWKATIIRRQGCILLPFVYKIGNVCLDI